MSMRQPLLRSSPMIALALLLVAGCGRPWPDGPPGSHRILVPVYFYQGHHVGKASRPTGLQASRDGGATWETLTWPELISSSVATDSTGRWLYLACGNGVMVSRDGGRSWRLTGGWETTEVQRVCIDRRDRKRAWAATAYGVVRTEDVLGPDDVWTKLEAPFRYCTDVRQDVSDPDTLWVAADTGVYVRRSVDDRFVAVIPGIRSRRLHQRPDGTILAATDRGLLRLRRGSKEPTPVDGVTDVAFCVAERRDGTLWVGGKGLVHVSRDGGRTWSEVREGIPGGFFVYGILADPDERRRVLACGNDGVLESRDDGATWGRLGFEGALVPDLAAARFGAWPRHGPSDAPGTLKPPVARDLEAHRPGEDPAFEARKEGVLRDIRNRPAAPEGRFTGWFRAAAAVRGGDVDEAFWAQARTALEQPSHSMFFTMPLIGFYLHGRDAMPADVADRIREVLTEVSVYRGDTENHWVMHYAALLLAAETWPETPASRWYAGRTTQELFDEAKGWLLHWARLSATRGQGEFDSPNYLFMYTTPMFLLHDFARDPEVRQVAGMMLDLLLADYLVESLGGAYCGGHSRIIGKEVEKTTGNRVSVLHHLYGGGIPRPQEVHVWSAFAALSSYRPPSVLAAIANRRDTPYVHRETKRVRNVIRLGELLDPPVPKVTYMARDHALGSLPGGIHQPVQQHSWDVTWRGSAENATLFTVHPSVSTRELAMFFPEEIHDIARTITLQKGAYGSPDKLVSASPWERIRQRENVLLALYRVPPGERFPHVDLYVPDGLETTEAGAWTIGRDGAFLVAWWAGQPGQWIRGDGYRRLRGDGRRAGFVVVTRPEGVRDVAGFRRHLAALRPELTGEGDDLALVLRGPERPPLRLAWGDPPPRFDMLYDGPFLRSRLGSGVIEMTDGETTRVLDFRTLTIERHP
jgi:hypothetical protein